MKEKTKNNLYRSFVGEAKAYFRLLAYAKQAEEEEFPQIAHLFRTIAGAEHVHATRHLKLLKEVIVGDSDTNLRESFQREKSVSDNTYPQFIKEAEEEGEKAAQITFSHARDAEKVHMKLYERALLHTAGDNETEYFVCNICGYIAEKIVPEKCPICGFKKEKFFRVK